ncbi:preprotein translocase subunit SecE [Kroppenstedtia eburnea]|uniref:Protein translocase subunit SecE n=1 Tax=Kroppenstedtia eburnea TaxID=714067 RepID=A0A1N7MZ91_9BACL|nr:preprotein translocase subunit SecE [Kroppenstedtia eburnea]EGK09713.1 Sec family type II general secretory pathway preprotein translocase SecE [Desmospora sp. 8437]QKI80742.1 preprotein translocase subunit SecE [Kroppenstedtia eburnea]SIS91338.1 preprotein translocase subunit SecE [Kroppenstedtia eburnea]
MGFLGRLGTGIKRSVTGTVDFFKTGVAELKKVRWPTRQELIKYTLVVVVTVILVTLFTLLIDMGIASLIEQIR